MKATGAKSGAEVVVGDWLWFQRGQFWANVVQVHEADENGAVAVAVDKDMVEFRVYPDDVYVTGTKEGT